MAAAGALGRQRHSPSRHAPLHPWPQVPQFALSFKRFAQLLPQSVYPLLHSRPQAPPLHAARPFTGAGHAAQPAPQCVGSLLVSAQVPLQLVRPP